MFIEDIDTEERQEADSVLLELRRAVVTLTMIMTAWVIGVIILGLGVLALWILVQAVADVL